MSDEEPDDFGLEPMEGRVLTSGWLVTIEWEMSASAPRRDTSFTTQRPGRYFVETKEQFPKARALICAVPAELTDDEIEMLS